MRARLNVMRERAMLVLSPWCRDERVRVVDEVPLTLCALRLLFRFTAGLKLNPTKEFDLSAVLSAD